MSTDPSADSAPASDDEQLNAATTTARDRSASRDSRMTRDRLLDAEVDRLAAKMRELQHSSRPQHRTGPERQRPASPHSPRGVDDDKRKQRSHPSPLFPSPSHPTFLDCALCQDGVHTPTTHRRLSTRHDVDEDEDDEEQPRGRRRSQRRSLSPTSHAHSPTTSPRHQRLPFPRPSHTTPASPSPSPALLAALSTLQSKVSSLHVHNRHLTAQLASQQQHSADQLDTIQHEARLVVQALQDRLAAHETAEARRRERWVLERAEWERRAAERDGRLAAMRDRMAQWERQVGAVNAEMRAMGDAIRQRDQKADEERKRREAQWDDERRAWKKRDGEREDERVEVERAMKRLVAELRDMNEELSRKEDRERRLRAGIHRLTGMDKEWKRLRNERRGLLDSRVVQCVRKQQELLTELREVGRGGAGSDEEKEERDASRALPDTETETADSDPEQIASRRAGTKKRLRQSATTRTRNDSKTHRQSMSHKQTVRDKSVSRQQPAANRPASSHAVRPHVARPTAAAPRLTRPHSVTGFAPPSYRDHAHDAERGVGRDGDENGMRTRPRVPATFLAERPNEPVQDYKSLFTPHARHGTHR